MKPLEQFIREQRITAKARWADSNPHMSDQKWAQTANHWKVVLRRQGKRLTIPFSQGSAITHEPTAEDVLDCLASDSAGIENARGDFEEWAREYGYGTDSRTAEREFKLCEKQAEKLKAFLGDGAYEELLWETERL